MKVAVSQISTSAHDFEHTTERMIAETHRAAEQGASLVVFSPPALTGTYSYDLLENQVYVDDISSALVHLSHNLSCPALVPASFIYNQAPHHEVFLVEQSRVTPLYLFCEATQVHVASASSDAEDSLEHNQQLSPQALQLPVFVVNGVRIGLVLTDRDLARYSHLGLDLDVILLLGTEPFDLLHPMTALGKSLGNKVISTAAASLGCWIVGVSGLGLYGRDVFIGSSFCMTPWGEIFWQAQSFKEDFCVLDIDVLAEGPLVEPHPFEAYQPHELLWDTLIFSLGEFVKQHGCTQLVVGLTGDIESCLLAALACDCLGPAKVCCLIFDTGDGKQTERARTCAQRLRLEAETVSLEPDALAMFGQAHLLQTAALEGGLVLGAADKTALLLSTAPITPRGFVFYPFADLFHTDILRLAELRTLISPVIPQECFERDDLSSASSLDSCLLRLLKHELTLKDEEELNASLAELDLSFLDAGAWADTADKLDALRAALKRTSLEHAGIEFFVALTGVDSEVRPASWQSAWSTHARAQKVASPSPFAESLSGLNSGEASTADVTTGATANLLDAFGTRTPVTPEPSGFDALMRLLHSAFVYHSNSSANDNFRLFIP